MAALALWAAAIGALVVTHTVAAAVLALVPASLLLALRPDVATVLAAAALPWFYGLAGGGADYGSSVQFDSTDLFLAAALVGSIGPILLRRSFRERIGDIGRAWLCLAPYSIWLLVILAAHFGSHEVVKTVRAYEVYLLPVLLGAVVLDRRTARWAMWTYVFSATGLAILWIATLGNSSFQQKNPSGQAIVLGLLVTLAVVRDWRVRLTILPVLGLGAIFTGSRGAILALVFAGIALLAIRGLGSWRRTAAAVLPLALAVILAYNFVPASVQSRLKTLSSPTEQGATPRGDLSAAQYSIAVRKAYREDAYAVIAHNRLLGVGTGSYIAGSQAAGTSTTDPHNVLLKVTAEQGYPGVILFALMILGTGWILLRRLKFSPWAALAVVVQVAAMAHAFVDVYWVRNTPVLSWLLVGMALNRRLVDRRRQTPQVAEP